MKRTFVIPALFGVAFLLFSCSKGGAPTSGAAPSGSQAVVSGGGTVPGAAPTAASVSGVSGHVLRVNAAFYTIEGTSGGESDKTKWAASMSLGEKVTAGQERRLTFAGDGTVYNFVEITRDDGSKGAAFATQIGQGGSLAVVVDDKANLYTSPKTVDVTGIILSYKTVVTVFDETERDGFVEIKAYDPVEQKYLNNYIRVSSLSKKDADIQSSILLQTAEPLKNEGSEKIKKEALLQAALDDYPDSVFAGEIKVMMNTASAPVPETVPAEVSSMVVNDNDVNVRDLPDQAAGKVIGQLQAGDEVEVSERTVEESTIGGQSHYWHHITKPFDGWVFGVYLDLGVRP